VRSYRCDARLLAEALTAISAAAEETPSAAQEALKLWPQFIDLVLDSAQADGKLFRDGGWGEWAAAALIPNPTDSSSYMSNERPKEPRPWIDLMSFFPQVERWLGAVPHSRMTIDQLVVAVDLLPIDKQLEHGLRWVERAVTNSEKKCASTFTLPEWLSERRLDLKTPDQQACWQRIVDYLVVAGDRRVANLSD